MTSADRPLRILHGPVNIGNQPWVLSRAERRLGVDSDVVINQGNWLMYPADRTLTKPGEHRALSLARRITFGATAPLRYDVLHYYFGRSYLYWDTDPHALQFSSRLLMADLQIARRLQRKVFMTLQGCDVRLAEASNARNAFTMCADGRCSLYRNCLSHTDSRRRWLIDHILPLCDRVFYLNPELGHYVPGGTFLPYVSIDLREVEIDHRPPAKRPRIAHSPTNRSIKGTTQVIAALDRLRERFDFEVLLIEGVPHDEAMRLYRSADLIIDQIWAGWYGGLAVETMALGKPVAAYIRQDDLAVVPEAMRRELPILQVRPDHLVDDLSGILQNRQEWPEIGRRSRAYVERWHSPDRIAAAMISAYRRPDSAFELPA